MDSSTHQKKTCYRLHLPKRRRHKVFTYRRRCPVSCVPYPVSSYPHLPSPLSRYRNPPTCTRVVSSAICRLSFVFAFFFFDLISYTCQTHESLLFGLNFPLFLCDGCTIDVLHEIQYIFGLVRGRPVRSCGSLWRALAREFDVPAR